MNRELYTEKFVAYANSFLTEDEDHNYHIILKREHTLRVAKLCDNIIENEEAIAEEPLPYLVGLFHDIGRFEQFKQYQSFHDATTVDHGLLGKKILESEHLLEGLSAPQKELLQYTTLHHNKLAIPESKDMLEFYTRLVRDADKLDIYHVLPKKRVKPLPLGRGYKR